MIMMMMMILLLVSQHALGGVVEVNQGAESVLLPCIYFGPIPEDNALLIWTRSDLSPNSVHLRRENSDDLQNQNQRFRDRTSMNPDALDTGNFSLTLRKPQQSDGGNYTFSISDGREERNLKQIHLKVKAYQLEVKVTEGSDSVVLPCTTSSQLPEDTSVEWTRSEPHFMFIHVFPNTSKHYAQQDKLYSCRTEMKKDFLRTGDVSLTLMYPTHRDDGRYVCTVYRGQDVLRHTVVLKNVKEPIPSWAKALLVLLVLVLIVSAGALYHFKYYFRPAPQVKVDSGVKSVLLPCRTKIYLPRDARVEWKNGENKTVHVYPNGSDDPEEQNLTSRTRMDDDPLKTKDLSLTLDRPSMADSGIYTCRVSIRKRVILVKKRVNLQVKDIVGLYQPELKASLKMKIQSLSEGVAEHGNKTDLNQINPELYITEGSTREVNQEHELIRIETASRKQETVRREDIFKVPHGGDQPIRTVMTMGVAGIGKTLLTQKFTLDWAEGKTNQNIDFIFPFTFRELNLLREEKFSLLELIHERFTKTKGIRNFESFQVLFIFDGLDESRFNLDFNNNLILTDVTESSSVDVLLTNLIRKELLPSALLWITTRPAAANQIPAQCVDMVTEVRGFKDLQKEEYFRKRFRDEEKENKIISHIKTSRSLHIMCHIPVFCWITATVLEDMLKTTEGGDLPKTLTEMYIHFLVVQAKVKKIKYDGGSETDPHWSPESRKMIESLGKLAFDQLQKGNLIFYEPDLRECGIDIRAASVYSGVFTQIFREERGLYQDKVFCFIHLSVQEFLAALHVHQTFINSGLNLLEKNQTSPQKSKRRKHGKHEFMQSAVDMALKSPNGHLDLFLRFFLGLSLQTNQTLLKDLLTREEPSTETTDETVQYIKRKMNEKLAADKIINLFDCLSEMNDVALVKGVQESLSSGSLSTDKLSSAQWSALVFILLSSEEDLNLFDLKKFINSDEDFARLLPVLEVSNNALLSVCNLSPSTCASLSTVLSSESSHLRELDLSNNDLRDEGVTRLCEGLGSERCTLSTLRLSGCLITEEGCASLASALRCNPSHLKELDLSYNHPGEEGVQQLTAQDSSWKPEKLRMEPAGAKWLKPGLKKYSCQLTIDTNTINRKLQLSENNRKVTGVDEAQSYPDHEQRFDYWPQVLCKESLPVRSYWEVIWSGKVEISVSYSGVQRKGSSNDCEFGFNNMSWSLSCSDEGRYSVCHENKREFISSCSSSAPHHKVGVYVDYPGGTLSFYRVSSEIPIHLHTLKTKFTQPLYPGFGFWTGSSATLC